MLALVANRAEAANGSKGGKPATTPQKSCAQLAPLGALKGASGIGTLLKGAFAKWTKDEDGTWTLDQTGGTDSLPGSSCYFKTNTPNTAYPQLGFETEMNLGYVAVGYGLSAKEWNKLVAFRCANGGSQPPTLWIPSSALNGHGKKKPVTLGLGSQAFALDFDLVASDEAEPVSFPQFPTDFYVVTVHTKNDDVLSAAVYGATLAKTEGLVRSILVANPKF